MNTTGTAYYAYDDAGHLLGEYDATGLAIYETVYFGDLPVAALTQPAAGQTAINYIYADPLNTARVIARASDHKIVWTWGSNEPFGQSAAQENPNGLGTFTYNPRFPGQVADKESGWFYNWHRDYDPGKGRYAESDPVGLAAGSMSTYQYTSDQPLHYVDPSGKIVIADDVIIIGGFVAIGCLSNPYCRKPFEDAAKSAAAVCSAGVDKLRDWMFSGRGRDNEPKSSLPRDRQGNYLPLPEAEGPHTTLGTRPSRSGGEYTQGATFGPNGEFLGRTDVTDHGRADHEDPHWHPATGPNSVGDAEPVKN